MLTHRCDPAIEQTPPEFVKSTSALPPGAKIYFISFFQPTRKVFVLLLTRVTLVIGVGVKLVWTNYSEDPKSRDLIKH